MEKFAQVFLTAFMFTIFFTPSIKELALRWGAVDRPDERRLNSTPVPTIGGLAIFLGFLVAVLISVPFSPKLMGIIMGGGLLIVIGLLDDLYELSAGIKLAGQILAACIALFYGIKIEFITNPLGGMFYLSYWGAPLTVVWIVAIINAVNLIDGLDGLASGVVTIASFTLLFVGWQEGQTFSVLLACAVAGSALGFLPINFNPASIFMGDTGSMFLGFMLAVISAEGALKSAAAATVLIPILALGFPIFDTLFAILRRHQNGQPIFEADCGHLHHRLLGLGLSQRQVAIIVYIISIGFGLAAIAINSADLYQAVLILALIFIPVVIGAWKLGLLRFKFSSSIAPEESHSSRS
ncbi:MAG: MraY family glycosyltransferase [Halanaerobium sp.]|nr:MraY family glycosyltransferase [Halanaerobium sp.]